MKKNILMPFKLPMDGFSSLTSDFEILMPDSSFSFSDELPAFLPIADALVTVFGQKVTPQLMDMAPNLRLIANYGVGYDNIDIDYASKMGIAVTNTPDPVTQPTAELTMAFLHALARNVVALHNGVINNTIQPWNVLNNLSTTLIGKTLGIVGLGAIGKAVAKRAIASGMKIIYFNRTRLNEAAELQFSAKYVDFKTLLSQADYVSLHLPLYNDNYHLIGKDELKLMKPSAFLINTSRGNIVNEKILIKALVNREIAGAALDVYNDEPNIPQALKVLNNVVLTPHVGTATHEARAAMSIYVANNIKCFFNDDYNIAIVNKNVINSKEFNKRKHN